MATKAILETENSILKSALNIVMGNKRSKTALQEQSVNSEALSQEKQKLLTNDGVTALEKRKDRDYTIKKDSYFYIGSKYKDTKGRERESQSFGCVLVGKTKEGKAYEFRFVTRV